MNSFGGLHTHRAGVLLAVLVAYLAAAAPVTAQAPTRLASAPDGAAPTPSQESGNQAPVGTGTLFVGLAAGDGPPPPMAPEVIRRDARGRATVRAIELTDGIRLDGKLDERVYRDVPAITGLIQQEPVEGAQATEKTEAWIMFDRTNIYVGARVWESAPPSSWVANEMRRDTTQLRDNDAFWVSFDTFYDRRNAVAFHTNPLGALGDFAITNEGNPNSDWNPVWDVRVGRFEGGWTLEMEIPFRSLRFRPGDEQVWGIQLRRTVRRKNERLFLTPVPISAGRGGIFRVSDYGTMVGLKAPGSSNNLEIKPYVIDGVSTDVE